MTKEENGPHKKSSPVKKAEPKEKKKPTVSVTLENLSDLNFRKQDHLVYELSVRWNYALPPWPPLDFDYSAKLKELGLRRVEAQRFRAEAEVENGLRKAFEVEGFSGQFRDSEGKLHDLRPRDSCPCISNFEQMPLEELQRLVMRAYEHQLQDLHDLKAKHNQYDRVYELDLVRSLQGKIKKLARIVEPSFELHLQPLAYFTDYVRPGQDEESKEEEEA